MTFFDFLFENKTVDKGVILKGYKFYSVLPDGKFLYYKQSDFLLVDIEQYMFKYLNIDDDYFYTPDGEEMADDDLIYLEYSHIEPLLSITVEGTFDRSLYPKCRKQLMAIRGTCDHKCPKNLPDDLSGYSLHKLPSCDGKYVGTTVWTGKISDNKDTIKDIWDWMRYCKGLDVLIINFDNTPIPFNSEGYTMDLDDVLTRGSNPDIKIISDLDFSGVCFCALIRGSVIRFINDTTEIEQLYHEYSSKYWCMDYDIEDSINSYNTADSGFNLKHLTDEEGAFRLEKPSGSKE